MDIADDFLCFLDALQFAVDFRLCTVQLFDVESFDLLFFSVESLGFLFHFIGNKTFLFADFLISFLKVSVGFLQTLLGFFFLLYVGFQGFFGFLQILFCCFKSLVFLALRIPCVDYIRFQFARLDYVRSFLVNLFLCSLGFLLQRFETDVFCLDFLFETAYSFLISLNLIFAFVYLFCRIFNFAQDFYGRMQFVVKV